MDCRQDETTTGGRFIDEELARDLLAADFDGSGFEDHVAEAVGRLGPLSIPLLHPLFEKNDPAGIPFALRILEDLPTEASVDLILTYWPLLWSEYKEWLLSRISLAILPSQSEFLLLHRTRRLTLFYFSSVR